MRFHRTALVLAGIFVLPAAAFGLDPREIFKLAEPSIVVVLAADAKGENNNMGSGVLIAPLEIVTSCKVIEGAADIVVTQGSALRKGRLQFQDRERDLCQLRIADPLPAAKPVLLAASSSSLESGQDVFTISSPQGMERTISRGMIAGLKETQGGSGRLIQLDAIMSPGARGGGVFDDKANLVGIVTPQFKQAEGASYALPVEWIADLGKRSPDLTAAVASTGAAAKPVDDAPKDNRWRPAKGDRWSYRLVDGKRAVGKVTIEVVESSPGRVRERVTKEGSAGFSVDREVRPEFETKAFLPLVTLPGGYQLLELSAYFPPGSSLEPGRQLGEISGEVIVKTAGKRRTVWKAKVAKQERIRVAAGEFDTWKIDAETTVSMHYGDVKVRYYVWYSPSMQRAVKTTLDTIWRIAVESTSETLELIAFDKAN